VEYLRAEHEQLPQAPDPFLSSYRSTAERINAIEAALESGGAKLWREELGKWAARTVPVELLVPEQFRQWRPLVHDAILFVVSRLSARRLAPKIVEQMEAAPDTPPEVRLLRFISKVPGLQKIGQVLARNRNLDRRLRGALAKLENGISDANFEEIRAILLRELGSKFETYAVKLDSAILSEASVSAVIGFSWRNPEAERRERGVFKVMKPYIPACYAEDMKILQQLAGYLARKHQAKGVRLAGVAETLTEIRLLLEREVDFPGEQATLLNALRAYRSIPGIRVPRLIQPFSTPWVTALTKEKGVKVTEAFARSNKLRVPVAGRLAETLVAVPALAREEGMIFHADPHAGNLLYDKRRGELVILDWALTGRLTRQERKSVLLLVVMTMLRDAKGLESAIERLRVRGPGDDPAHVRTIRDHIARLLDALPLLRLPSPADAMRLLDAIAMDGIRFPASLLMFRKAWFTLEGVLEDIAGTRVDMNSAIARHALTHWVNAGGTLLSLFSPADWVALDASLLTLASRWCARALFRPWRWVRGLPLEAEAA